MAKDLTKLKLQNIPEDWKNVHMPHADLVKMTDDFIDAFIKKTHELEEDTQRGHSDSFIFNYTFVDALMNSTFVKKEIDPNRMYIPMGFVQNVVKEHFKLTMRGVTKEVMFVIQHFEDQEEYSDFRAVDMKRRAKAIEKNDFHFNEETGKLEITKVKKPSTIVTYRQENSKNGHDEKIEVLFIEDELEHVDVYNDDGDLILHIKDTDEPEVKHVKYCADVNSFLGTMQQIVFGIEEQTGAKFEY